MKLNNFELEKQLQRTLAKFYIIYGDEPLIINESLKHIRQRAKAAGCSERLRVDIENDDDLEVCYNHAYTPGLFNHKRLLELHWKAKPSKASQQFLSNYATNPSSFHIVLAYLSAIDNKVEQTAWFKTLEANSLMIRIWPIPPKQLPTWLKQRAKVHNLDLSTEAAEYLAYAVEGNLSAAAQEIEKLSLYGVNKIERTLIETLVVDQGCFTAFDLSKQAFSGDLAQSIRILRYLKNEGTEPPMILGALAYELRLITKLITALEAGSSLPHLFKQQRIHLSRQETIRAFLRHKPTSHYCQQLLLQASYLDRIIKGALPGSIWEGFEDLCIAICQGKTSALLDASNC